MFEVCFENQNVRIAPSRWLFAKRQAMRFEWLALLAFRRVAASSDNAWVTLDDIALLPSWSGKTRHHIATNVGRYLQMFEQAGLRPVVAKTRWAGPYRLQMSASAINFDLPISEVEKRLQVQRQQPAIDRRELFRFTLSYTRAQWLVFQGRLVSIGENSRVEESAYKRFLGMAGDLGYCPRLRLMACISAVRVLFRLGRFQAARHTLEENLRLAQAVGDRVLKAQYYLALAWSHQRGASGMASNRATERALSAAREYAEDSGDRASLGLLAYRTSGYLTKKGRHRESIDQLLYAVEAALITGNYDGAQAYCNDVGSVIHRLGLKYYREARSWLLLGIAIARWMKIGRDDAHGEMILGKIYTELGKQPKLARFWLQRAERIAQRSGNQVNLADVKMVWGFWHQRFGTHKVLVETLGQELLMFRSLRDFDCRQKERYMARKFPSVWPDVTKLAEFPRYRRRD
jgi:tetratricopeptide (TPR) repeat protein